MFSIYDGRTEFYQWDLNQKLIVEDNTITQVHFCNKTDDCALVCEVYVEGDKRLVNVPNVLLQTDWKIRVYGYCADYTKVEKVFKVNTRNKPADYIYTETEVLSFEELERRLEEKADNLVQIEYIKQALFSMTSGGTNIIECKLTNGTVTQFDIRNGEQGEKPVKGVDYYTEEDKQELVADVLNSLPSWNGGSY